MSSYEFDATQVDPRRSFEPIPAGTYRVIISASEMKDTKAGDGKYLKLEIEVIEGEHQGAKIFDNLNLVNKNKETKEIADASLSAICHAVGKLRIMDSEELHNLPLMAKVSLSKAQDGYEAKNKISGYSACESTKTSAKPAPPVTTSKPPWM